MKAMKTQVAVVAIVMMSGAAHAALVDRGGGLIYDDVLNVTWLQDANYAKTSGYDADGKMTWSGAMDWVSGLRYFDSVRGVTYDDWRLPTSSPVNGIEWRYSWSMDGVSSDRSYNIKSTSSEMSYMYYVNLGLVGEYSVAGDLQTNFGVFGNGTYTFSGEADIGLIANVQNSVYWTGVELGRNPYIAPSSDYAWWFVPQLGSQYFAIKSEDVYAWAVRDGDVVTPSPVPLPAAWGLFLAGLGAMRLMSRVRAH